MRRRLAGNWHFARPGCTSVGVQPYRAVAGWPCCQLPSNWGPAIAASTGFFHAKISYQSSEADETRETVESTTCLTLPCCSTRAAGTAAGAPPLSGCTTLPMPDSCRFCTVTVPFLCPEAHRRNQHMDQRSSTGGTLTLHCNASRCMPVQKVGIDPTIKQTNRQSS